MAVADWDWLLTNETKSLDPAYYKSAPTSLKITATGNCANNGCLSRLAGAQNIPQGELRAWLKRGMNLAPGFVFRSQDALGVVALTNCYRMENSAVQFHLYVYLAGVQSDLGVLGVGLDNNQEVHARLVWWNGENLSGVAALAVQLYFDDGAGNWLLQGTLYDTNNRWKDSSINRVGHRFGGASGNYGWIDDTEIWIPST